MNSTAVPLYVHDLLVASGQGLHSITNTLSHILALPVIVTDTLFYVQSHSDDKDATGLMDINISNEHEGLIQFELTTMNHHKTGFGSVITISNKTLGYLLILTDNQSIELDDYRSILTYTSFLCALNLKRKMELRQERMKFKDAFLFDLLYGNLKNKEDIYEYGKLWNWNFSAPHLVMVFSIRDFDYITGDKQWLKLVLRVVEKVLKQKNIQPITMLKQHEVIAVIALDHVKSNKRHSDIREFAASILHQTKELLSAREISCGIGKMYADPTELFRSYQEAKVAFELGISLDEDISFFEHLGLERIIYRHDLQDLKEFFIYTLGELQQYDIDNGTDLMDTLESYAANEYDIQKTSQALFLHRNTLRYRIKKIEEILQLKLDVISVKLNISTAFKIKKLRKI
ncbi:PucR family transcriptional regulator [Brevibacillus ginsengisoli]|uniref:PucR family transcriptional regulator n=1 Tax=Brevibacillus ginsengisoli TaxID=363854 RepID=UPI003CF6361E